MKFLRICVLLYSLIFLSGCTTPIYNDLSYANSTTTIELQVKSEDSDLLNDHKVYIGEGEKVNGYINTDSGRKRISSHKPVYLTIEYIHWVSKVVTYKYFILHPQPHRNYVILINLKDQQNKLQLKELSAGQLKDVDIDRIELR